MKNPAASGRAGTDDDDVPVESAIDRRQLLAGLAMAGLAAAPASAAVPVGSAGRSNTGGSAGAHAEGIREWKDAVFSLRSDPRFIWSMYVPESFSADPAGHSLAVAVHSSYRDQSAMREGFLEFARFNRFVILAPMFPVSVLGDGNVDGYKYIAEGDIRYDRVLLDMVAEIGTVLQRDFSKFMLFGFSGGGHFVHRFLYLHPERLDAVAIGSPGGITLIDDSRDFWLGTRNIEALFGTTFDLAAIRRVKVQLLIGANDVEPFPFPPKMDALLAYRASLGRNRLEVNEALFGNYRASGLDVRRVVIPNCAHDVRPMIPAAQDFFLTVRDCL